MPETWFITGTDTGVGKTLIAAALLVCAARGGRRTLGLKPLASGSRQTALGLRHEDALALQAAATVKLPYEAINPFALEPAIAPHIALRDAGIGLDAEQLLASCQSALRAPHDFAVVEGAGGWRVPLNEHETLADFARLLGVPVVLVVGLRLGCINHAVLSAEAIHADGLRLAGWVANQVDPTMPRLAENLASLDRLVAAPRIGFVPYLSPPTAEMAARHIDLDALRG